MRARRSGDCFERDIPRAESTSVGSTCEMHRRFPRAHEPAGPPDHSSTRNDSSPTNSSIGSIGGLGTGGGGKEGLSDWLINHLPRVCACGSFGGIASSRSRTRERRTERERRRRTKKEKALVLCRRFFFVFLVAGLRLRGCDSCCSLGRIVTHTKPNTEDKTRSGSATRDRYGRGERGLILLQQENH